MSETPHLFGLVDAELLFDSVAKVYEFTLAAADRGVTDGEAT